MNTKFELVNNNPKGKITCDCVIRALVTATELDVKTILDKLVHIYITKGWFIADRKCYEKFLAENGYVKYKQPKYPDGTKFTADDFCEYLNYHSEISGVVVARVGGHHVSTFVNDASEIDRDYKVHDTWDCTGKCVGNYWVKSSY